MEEKKDIKTNKKEKKKTDVKKTLRNLVALVLVAVISIVGTLAYLQQKTGPVKNTFTGSDDITLKVIEPNWEKNPGKSDETEKDEDDNDKTDSEGNVIYKDKVDSYDPFNKNDTGEGELLAESYTPELEILKDPKLYNTSKVEGNNNYEEWVAIRVDYYIDDKPVTYGGTANANPFDGFAKASSITASDGEKVSQEVGTAVIEPIEFNNVAANNTDDAYWIDITPETLADGKKPTYQIYAYSKRLGYAENSNVTEALFDKIKINKNIAKVDHKYTVQGDNPDTAATENEYEITKKEYPKIDIYISGGALKVEDKHAFDTLKTIASGETGYNEDDEDEKAEIKNALLSLLNEITIPTT